MNSMELEGKSVSILGLGSSGMAAAALSVSKGGRTYVSDLRADTSTRTRATALEDLGVDVELGGHDVERMAESDFLVVSPGVSPDVPVLSALRMRGVDWVSEPEFAFHFLNAPVIAVTGTNGKTTTAALTAHLLESGGLTVGLGGNIGASYGPAASYLALRDPTPDWFVLEMSSFQLADIDHFKPTIGVITNLAPDHLDRYPTVDEYYADKARIFANADDESTWVLFDQLEVVTLSPHVAGTTYRFGFEEAPGRAAYVANDVLTVDLGDGPEAIAPTDAMQLLGGHNVENALAATLVARLVGVEGHDARSGLETFEPLEHRLEAVADVGGVLWVNDSKATNVAATTSAILSLHRPVVLLLGGVDKGESFLPLREIVSGAVRAIVAYGEVADRIREELEEVMPVVRGGFNFDAVVEKAADLAQPGDIVLLSPATSSYDMFRNYEDRGDQFRSIAQNVGRSL